MVQKGESRLSKVLIYNLLTIMGIFYFKIVNKMLHCQETIIRLTTIIFFIIFIINFICKQFVSNLKNNTSLFIFVMLKKNECIVLNY